MHRRLYIGRHIVFYRILSRYVVKHSRIIGNYCTQHAFVAYTLHDRAGIILTRKQS